MNECMDQMMFDLTLLPQRFQETRSPIHFGVIEIELCTRRGELEKVANAVPTAELRPDKARPCVSAR